MKKIRLALITLCIFTLAALNAYAAVIDSAEITEKTVNNQKQDVFIIEGEDPNLETDKRVTVTVLKQGFAFPELASGNPALMSNYILNTAVVRTDDDGKYSYEFVMKAPESIVGDESTFYVVCVSVGGKFETVKTAYFSSDTRLSIIKNYINTSSDSSQLKNNIDAYGEMLGINKKYYDLLADKKAVSEILRLYLPFDETSVSDFQKDFQKASIVRAVNENKITDFNKALTDYGQDITGEYAKFYSQIAEAYKKNFLTELAQKSSKNFEDFEENTKMTIVKYALCHNATEGYAHVSSVLEFSGINLSVYNAASNKQYINSKLINYDFSTMAQLEERIRELAKTDTGSSPSGSGTGGGGSSKKDVITSSGGVAPTVTISDGIGSLPQLISGFSDIGGVEWAHEAITSLTDKNVITGMGNNIFAPDNDVTREQFALMLQRAFNLSYNGSETVFSDVLPEAWSYSGVMACYENGIVMGVRDDFFGASDKITREDMAVMLYRTAVKMNIISDNQMENTFSDADEFSDYSLNAVSILADNAVLNGMGDNRFNPKGTATRAQAAVCIYKLMNVTIAVPEQTEIKTDMSETSDSSVISYMKLLSRLGIISNKTEENLTDIVTRKEFAQAALKMIHIDFDASEPQAEEILKHYGFSDNEELNEAVTYGETAKVIITILGYGTIMDAGNINSYINKANELNIFAGIIKSAEESVVFSDMAKILQNTLQAERMVMSYSGSAYGSLVKSDKNLLEENFNLRVVRGIVTKNEYTSLYGTDNTGRNNIEIDNTPYTTLFEESKYYLGYNVVAYADADDKIVFLKKAPGKNGELTIGPLSEPEYANYAYTYYDDSGKLKRIRINDCAVIYNQQSLSEYSNVYMIPSNGEITFIDNNNDGSCDVVKITGYEKSIVVSYTQEHYYRIFDKYGEGAYESLDETGKESVEIVDTDGNIVDFTAIKPGNTVTVAKSYNGSIITAIVSDTAVYGIFNEISSDKINGYYTLTAGENKYLISESAYQNFGKKLIRGQTYKYTLDYCGNIVDASESGFDLYKYAYMINAYVNTENGESDTYIFKLFTADGAIEYVENEKDKLKINGETVKSLDAIRRNIGNDSEVESQLIRYKTNSSGKLTEIITVGNNCNINTDKLFKKYDGTYSYLSGSKMFYGKAPLSDSCIVFTIPSNPKTAEAAQFGLGTANLEGKMHIKGYVTDKDSIEVDALVAEVNSSALLGGTIMTVQSILTGVSSEDEECYILTGPAYDGNITEEKTVYIGKSLLDSVTEGDIIRYTILMDNIANSATILYDYDIISGEGTIITRDKNGESISDGIGYPSASNYSNILVPTMSYIIKRSNGVCSVNQYPLDSDEYKADNDIIYKLDGAPIYKVSVYYNDCIVEKSDVLTIPDSSTGQTAKIFIITKYGTVKYCIVYE